MGSELTAVLKAALEKHTRRGGPEECWPWCGPLNGGLPRLRGRVNGRALNLSARKVVYERARDKVARGRVIGDTCGNPQCLNPAHLVVTSSVAVTLSRRPATPAPVAPVGGGFPALAEGMSRLTRADVPALDGEIAALDARRAALSYLRSYAQSRPVPVVRAEVRAPAPAPKKPAPARAKKASQKKASPLARRVTYFVAAQGATGVDVLAKALTTTPAAVFAALPGCPWLVREGDRIAATAAGVALALEGTS